MEQEELENELIISQNKYMTCSICELQIGFNHKRDELLMKEHFEEKHNLKKD